MTNVLQHAISESQRILRSQSTIFLDFKEKNLTTHARQYQWSRNLWTLTCTQVENSQNSRWTYDDASYVDYSIAFN